MWALSCCPGRFILLYTVLIQVIRPTEGQFGFGVDAPSEFPSEVPTVAPPTVAPVPTNAPITLETLPPIAAGFEAVTTAPTEATTETEPPTDDVPATVTPFTVITTAPSIIESFAPTKSSIVPGLPIETKPPTLAPVIETKAPVQIIETSVPTAAEDPLPEVNVTLPPETDTATTSVPTEAPTTLVPETPPPTNPVPVTASPTTSVPATAAPVTAAPTTPAPTTAAPTTAAPTTSTPTAGPADPIVDPTEETEPSEPTEPAEPEEATEPAEPTEPPETTEAPIEPTLAPTIELSSGIASGLRMTLEGMTEEMSASSADNWVIATESHVETYWTNTNGYEVDATITVMDQQLVSAGSRLLRKDSSRLLQASQLIVTYNQESQYRVAGNNIDAATLALDPFATANDRDEYVEILRDSNDASFSTVTGVAVTDGESAVTDPVTDPPFPAPATDAPTDAPSGISTGAIAGIVAGGGGLVLIFALILFFRSRASEDGSQYAATKAPPAQLDVKSGSGGGEEVSRLDEPAQPKVSAPTSNESLPGYGDQSVATVDYDYSKAYGGGGDTSVSSAGGTFGSNTHAQSAGGAAVENTTGGPLDTSFSESGSQHRGQSQNVKEELIDIYAPPGKLGVVIDTPDDGAPVVHAVKDSSVIADKLQVGDKLVAVDDEDVRSMTAIKVSKLISRKSTNPTRKLTIIRTVVVDE